MKKGTIVDSTIIECSTSKRNKDKACDADASWAKKAGSYKHGYKMHNGVDRDSGFITWFTILSNESLASNKLHTRA